MKLSLKTIVSGLFLSCGVLVVACSSAPGSDGEVSQESAALGFSGPIHIPTLPGAGQCMAPRSLHSSAATATHAGCPATINPADLATDDACCAKHVAGYAVKTGNGTCPAIALDQYNAVWYSKPASLADGLTDDGAFGSAAGYTCEYLFANIVRRPGTAPFIPAQIAPSNLCSLSISQIGYVLPSIPLGMMEAPPFLLDAGQGPPIVKMTGCDVCVDIEVD